MALEMTGFTRANLDALWIDPADYKAELSTAVRIPRSYGLRTSVYNHQLCLVNSDVEPAYVKFNLGLEERIRTRMRALYAMARVWWIFLFWHSAWLQQVDSRIHVSCRRTMSMATCFKVASNHHSTRSKQLPCSSKWRAGVGAPTPLG
ncbi:hypothetical protein CBM2626_U40031 [Cupriavidus taiwanensis]|nr:hypothetical protein CBM2626_U40031 [Cupriavidus taiwanensis]SPA57672.1 hypothetical protein CBM2638_U20006 [Cupriavidus taiwanensis]